MESKLNRFKISPFVFLLPLLLRTALEFFPSEQVFLSKRNPACVRMRTSHKNLRAKGKERSYVLPFPLQFPIFIVISRRFVLRSSFGVAVSWEAAGPACGTGFLRGTKAADLLVVVVKEAICYLALAEEGMDCSPAHVKYRKLYDLRDGTRITTNTTKCSEQQCEKNGVSPS